MIRNIFDGVAIRKYSHPAQRFPDFSLKISVRHKRKSIAPKAFTYSHIAYFVASVSKQYAIRSIL